MRAEYGDIREVIEDDLFPSADLALRQGRHVDRDDGELYLFLEEAEGALETFYRRFGCQLVRSTDGFFYLLPVAESIRRRQLSVGEMLVGQTLALMYLEPSTVQAAGRVSRSDLLSRLAGLLGEPRLVTALNPRRKKYVERVAAEQVRAEVDKALRALAALGFIEMVADDVLRLRMPLLRFAEPVRGLADRSETLARLIVEGKAALLTRGEDDDREDEEP